ncbi:hypothetical protein BBJ28_00000816, partial [Nothophytophthora sp. Chile5]
TLTTLLLSNAGISDEAAPYLKHVLAHTRSLTHLNLSCNAFTSAGGIAIARGLQQNSTLRYLNYRENKVEESAAVALLSALAAHSFTNSGLKLDSAAGILAKSLQKNTALGFVNLSYNEITLRGCKLLRDGVAARGENAARLVLSLEGNSGEKCPTGTIITGGMRPVRPPLIH